MQYFLFIFKFSFLFSLFAIRALLWKCSEKSTKILLVIVQHQCIVAVCMFARVSFIFGMHFVLFCFFVVVVTYELRPSNIAKFKNNLSALSTDHHFIGTWFIENSTLFFFSLKIYLKYFRRLLANFTFLSISSVSVLSVLCVCVLLYMFSLFPSLLIAIW